jgi:ferrous iron transport protein A
MASVPDLPTSPASASPTVALDRLRTGMPARVLTVGLSPQDTAWLHALGLFEGQRVTVLRRGIFGGPLHVRTGSGGELAIDRSLAARVEVAPEPRSTQP